MSAPRLGASVAAHPPEIAPEGVYTFRQDTVIGGTGTKQHSWLSSPHRVHDREEQPTGSQTQGRFADLLGRSLAQDQCSRDIRFSG